MSFGRTAARDGSQVCFLLAVQLALPARPWLVIDGGLKSFLDEPLAHSGNGSSVDQKRTGYLTVPNSFICFEQRQRPLDGADRRLAPVGNLIETGAFGFSQLDFILDGSHVWILPRRKIIPKYGCLLIFLQIYLETVLVQGCQYEFTFPLIIIEAEPTSKVVSRAKTDSSCVSYRIGMPVAKPV